MGGRGGSSHRVGGGGGNVQNQDFANARAFLERTYGAAHANAILAMLGNAPSYVQEMWAEYGDLFRAARDRSNSSDAYYSPAEDRVHLGIANVARGDSIHPPYATIYHEYGHMTDYLIARTMGHGNYTAYSETYKNGLLGRTAKKELEGHLNRFMQNNMTRTQAAEALAREARSKYSMLDRSDISDMMEGAGIGIAYPLSSGHGLSYWNSRDNGKEIFAEITSAEVAHPGSLKAIKDYFPETYQVFQQMVKERKKR